VGARGGVGPPDVRPVIGEARDAHATGEGLRIADSRPVRRGAAAVGGPAPVAPTPGRRAREARSEPLLVCQLLAWRVSAGRLTNRVILRVATGCKRAVPTFSPSRTDFTGDAGSITTQALPQGGPSLPVKIGLVLRHVLAAQPVVLVVLGSVGLARKQR